MTNGPIEAAKHAHNACKEILALARYYNKEAYVCMSCGDYDKAKHHQDAVDMCIAMMECLKTLENGEES